MEGGRSPTGIEGLGKVDFYWRLVFDPAVWPDGVVGFSKLCNAGFCIQQVDEPFTIQAFISEAAVEAFHERILPGAAWLDVDGTDLMRLEPLLDSLGHQFRTVVTADKTRSAKLTDQLLQDLYNLLGGEGTPDLQGNAKSAVFIHDTEDADTATVFGHIVDKVPAPDFVHLAGTLFVPG